MKKIPKVKGSMTVYATLSLMIVASLIFAYLENGRIEGLRAYVKMDGISSTRSLLSMYNNELFERYGVLVLDSGFGQDVPNIEKLSCIMQEYSQNNLKPIHNKRYLLLDTVNFFQMDCSEASVEGYQLATDDKGAAFRTLCAQSMKYEFAIDVIQDLLGEMQEATEQAAQAKLQVKNASDSSALAIEEAKNEQLEADIKEFIGISEKSENRKGSKANNMELAIYEPEEDVPQNPAEIVGELKEMDVLSLLVPSDQKLSTKKITGHKSLTKRKLNEGNYEATTEKKLTERILFDEFIYTNFEHYIPNGTSDDKARALDYEMEYIVSGKSSDKDNLRQVVGDILAIREGMNFLYLLTDVEKYNEARTLAISILSAYPVAEVAEELVALGILAAWAFGESVLDVRSLLAGGHVQWFKTYDCWTLGLDNIGELAQNDIRAKEPSVGGDDYEGYIKKLLFTKLEKTLNYRVMDLMEMNLNATPGYENCKMDCMLISLKVGFSYEAESLFPKFVTVVEEKPGNYIFTRTVEDSYLEKIKDNE